MATPLTFEIFAHSQTTRARVGRVTTQHGAFDTPAFMPVGTKGTVKGILPELVERTGAQILLNNTYHLLLRPGPELVHQLGGVHRFMNWPRPILTDSGGYQAYSLSDTNAVDDDGVTFKSIVDGARIRLTPEEATRVQNLLGADIIMAFDDCPPATPVDGGGVDEGLRGDGTGLGYDPTTSTDEDGEAEAGGVGTAGRVDPRLARAVKRDAGRRGYDHQQRLAIANERTVRWLERCKAAHARKDEQALFGIVQGGTDLDRRTWSAERIAAIDLPGYAIGGVAVGESAEDIARVVRHTAPLLPPDKPRYLMGVGYERDILAAVLAGIDMFDCVLPTRNGRNASAFTSTGPMKLRNAKYAEDPRPIEAGCDCEACRERPAANGANWMYSRAYLRHLFMAEEMLGPVLVTLHNLRHFQRFMLDIRRAVAQDDWLGLVGRWPVAAAGLPAGQ